LKPKPKPAEFILFDVSLVEALKVMRTDLKLHESMVSEKEINPGTPCAYRESTWKNKLSEDVLLLLPDGEEELSEQPSEPQIRINEINKQIKYCSNVFI
jgi:hypothetical protein